MTLPIARNLAGQLRYAADDPDTDTITLRQGLRDAADAMDAQETLILAQCNLLDHLRLHRGVLVAFALVVMIAAAARFAGAW